MNRGMFGMQRRWYGDDGGGGSGGSCGGEKVGLVVIVAVDLVVTKT